MIFNLRLTTKRELLLWQATMESQAKEIERLKMQNAEMHLMYRGMVEHEQKRAEGAINLLLAKTTGAVIAQPVKGIDDMTKLDGLMMDIFGKDEIAGNLREQERQEKIIAEMQS